MEQDCEGLVLLLLQQGSQRQAIELYREETGVSSHEAELAVAELARQHGIRLRKYGWWPAVLGGLAGVLGAILAF
jgi:hypothetical protein